MNEQTDASLLRAYAEQRAEPAFAELVRRYVDFVYSAAQRMVCDSHLADDVTQAVFLALSKNAAPLADRTVLSGWLHRTAQNIAAQTVRSDVRRRAREQEAASLNESTAAEADVAWEQIAPHLDDALGELSEPDRDALLLRYFERKTAREMAQVLGISDEAAQKRAARAVERLRDFFAKRGIAVGASGLTGAITAHSVQSAPLGLGFSISTAAGLGATTPAAMAAGEALALTALQKTVLTTVVVASVLMPMAVQQEALSRLRQQAIVLRQQAAQLVQLGAANQRLSNLLASANGRSSRSDQQFTELLRLRGEVGRLNRDVKELTQLNSDPSTSPSNGPGSADQLWSGRVNQLKHWLDENSSEKIPELQFLTDRDWIEGVYPHKLESDEEYRRSMSVLRSNAELRAVEPLLLALRQYSQENGGQFPSGMAQLKSFLKGSIDDAILGRYEIVPAADLIPELRPGGDWAITQKSPVNAALDTRFAIGLTDVRDADETVTNRWRRIR